MNPDSEKAENHGRKRAGGASFQRRRLLSRACAMQYAFLMDVHDSWEAAVTTMRDFRTCLRAELALDEQAGTDFAASGNTPFPASMIATTEELDKAWEYAQRLIRGIAAKKAELDDLIRTAATNWTLERMSLVDRAILRLATFEITFQTNVPAAAAINDAIELAKIYGEADSQRFVNGVLDRIRMNLGRPTSQAKAAIMQKKCT